MRTLDVLREEACVLRGEARRRCTIRCAWGGGERGDDAGGKDGEGDQDGEDEEDKEDEEGKDARRSPQGGIYTGTLIFVCALRHKEACSREGLPFGGHDADDGDGRGSKRGGSARPSSPHSPRRRGRARMKSRTRRGDN